MQNSIGQERTPNFTTIVKALDGGPAKAGDHVIQTEKEWGDFVATCQSEEIKKKLLATKIDFSKETVVVIAERTMCILGSEYYENEWGIQKVTSKEGEITVEHNRIHSDHLDTKEKSQFHVIKTAKAKKVTFKPDLKIYAG